MTLIPKSRATKPIILATLFLSIGFAQSPPTEPEFADVFYRLVDSKLVTLERQNSSTHTNAHGFMVMSMKSSTEFPGPHSTVRFNSGEPLEFVVKSLFGQGFNDPAAIYSLRKLGEKKKVRELVMMSGKIVPFSMNTNMSQTTGSMPIDFAKYGAGSLKLASAPLPPGEYALVRIGGQSAFCFGID